jgi:hypothetical protein
MCASLAVCTVVRLIAVVAFNPMSDKTVKFLTMLFSGGTVMFTGATYVDGVYTAATAGGSAQPVPGFLTNLCQKQTFGCTAATSEEVDLAKVYFAVFNRPAPTYPGTERIHLDRALQELNSIANEYDARQASRYVGKIPGLNPSFMQSQVNSGVEPKETVVPAFEKAPSLREAGSAAGSKTAALTLREKIVPAIENAPSLGEADSAAEEQESGSLDSKKTFRRVPHHPWIIEENASPFTQKPLEADPFFKSTEVPEKEGLAQEKSFRELVKSALKDFMPVKGRDDDS